MIGKGQSHGGEAAALRCDLPGLTLTPSPHPPCTPATGFSQNHTCAVPSSRHRAFALLHPLPETPFPPYYKVNKLLLDLQAPAQVLLLWAKLCVAPTANPC